MKLSALLTKHYYPKDKGSSVNYFTIINDINYYVVWYIIHTRIKQTFRHLYDKETSYTRHVYYCGCNQEYYIINGPQKQLSR